MGMAATIPYYTVADLEHFPSDGIRYELLDGVLLVTPQAGFPHQVIAARLIAKLHHAVEPLTGVFAVAPGAVVLAPRTQLQPDVLVVTQAAPITESWEDVSGHLLAVEIISPSSRIYDRDFKCNAYLALGVAEVWLVDRRDESVEVARSGVPRVIEREAVTWQAPSGGAQVTIGLKELFGGFGYDLDVD